MAAALVLAAGVVAAPTANASQAGCLVVNERTEIEVGSLQEGIDAAATGDTLLLRGTCVGSFTITKSLTVKGVGSREFGAPTLDGQHGVGGPCESTCEGRILGLRGMIAVTLIDLRIANGAGRGIENFADDLTLVRTTVAGNAGGGIFTMGGTLTLVDSEVMRNSAPFGGGISNSHGAVVLRGTSSVHGNTALSDGGGIASSATNFPGVMLTDSSSVHGNVAGEDGGGIFNGDGRTDLFDRSSVHHNTAGGDGGGIVSVFARVMLWDSSAIHHNTSAGDGGGASNELFGRLAMNDSSVIHHNSAGGNGGGVLNSEGGAVELHDASRIDHNVAGGTGGGVFDLVGDERPSGFGTVTIADAGAVTHNAPDNCYPPDTIAGCRN